MNITNNKFSKKNGSVHHTSSTPLDLQQLQTIAPSIFAPAAHSSRSERYSYVPTVEVLERIMREGFRPYSIMQGGSREEEKRGFTKHLIRLRHDSQQMIEGGNFNEILLMNSHDGTSSYRMMAGVFRMVCGNGMIVAQSMVDDVRVSHKGDIAGRVLDGCISVLDRLPLVEDSIKRMSAISLSNQEQMAFAGAALIAKYGEEPAPIQPSQLLTVRRTTDAAPTLWNTLNRAQEMLIRGGARYTHTASNGKTSSRRTRAVNGIDRNTNINRALWALAESMAEIKAA